MTLMRHLRAFGEAWKAESHRKKQERRWVQTEFLPAAMEIAETPPSPIGRAIIWSLMLAALSVLAWSFLATIDIVAVAEGRLVPVGRLQTVEAADAGIVKAINVREGEHVDAGEVLIELDPTVANADVGAAKTELATAALKRARAAALLEYVGTRRSQPLFVPGADPAALSAEQQLVWARIQEFEAKRDSIRQRRTAAEAAIEVAQQEALKLSETLPLVREQVDALRTLAGKGLAPRLKVAAQEERLVGVQRDLAAQRAHIVESQAQAKELDQELAQAVEQFRGQAAQEKSEAENVFATRSEDVRKADKRQALQQLAAPVTGTIHEVSVATIGEVVAQGKPIVTIVPDGGNLVVEALLPNREAGFVRGGDKAVVKLEAYPFNRYGVLKGHVEHVSPDAITDERRGLVFPVRVALDRTTLRVDGREARVSSGMQATVEIVTGRRRVIEYLWSPIARTASSAGRER